MQFRFFFSNRHDIIEILLKVALNNINQPNLNFSISQSECKIKYKQALGSYQINYL